MATIGFYDETATKLSTTSFRSSMISPAITPPPIKTRISREIHRVVTPSTTTVASVKTKKRQHFRGDLTKEGENPGKYLMDAPASRAGSPRDLPSRVCNRAPPSKPTNKREGIFFLSKRMVTRTDKDTRSCSPPRQLKMAETKKRKKKRARSATYLRT